MVASPMHITCILWSLSKMSIHSWGMPTCNCLLCSSICVPFLWEKIKFLGSTPALFQSSSTLALDHPTFCLGYPILPTWLLTKLFLTPFCPKSSGPLYSIHIIALDHVHYSVLYSSISMLWTECVGALTVIREHLGIWQNFTFPYGWSAGPICRQHESIYTEHHSSCIGSEEV